MVSEPPIMVVPCCEVAMTNAEKESEARCKEMLNQLISVVKKQTSEIEDLAKSMKELAAGLKAVVQPLGATAHALPLPVPAPTATLVTMVDYAVAAAAPRAEAALTPESPTKCSTSGPDTNAGDIQVVAESEPEKGVPTVAPALTKHSSAPSPKLVSTIKQDTVTSTRCSTACRSCNTDVAITSHAPSIGTDVDHAEAEATPCTDSIRAAVMLANCSTPRGGLKAWFRELPGGMLDSLPMEEVMQCPSENDCAQLCTKLDDEMPRKWFDCYQGGVPWMPSWPPPQGPGTLLELFHKQAGVQSWMTKFTNAAMDMLNSHELPWDPGDVNLSNIDSRCFVIVKSRAKGRKTPLLILLRTPNIQFIMMAAELVKQCSDINNMDFMLVRCKNDKGSEKDLMDNFIKDKLMIDVSKMLRLFPGFGKWVCNNPRDRVGAVLTDGETVLKEVELEDPLEILGVKLVRQAGARTNDIAGDNCTTSTILAQGLIAEGMKVLAAGIIPVQITRGIEKTAAALVSELKLKSREIEVREIAHVAAVSAGNDYSVGDIISDAFKRVGRKGTVRIENGRGTETGLEVVKGMQFERGYLSPYFVTNRANMSVEFIDCKILLVDKKSTDASEIIKILDSTVKENYPLLITAEDMEEEARAPLIRNKLSGTIKVAAIKAPSFGEQKTQCLDDIAIMTGGTVVRDDMGYTLERAGKEVYSYFMEDKNVTLFFSCVYPLVGATLDDHYTAFGDLDKSRQALVEQWSKVAYEHMKFDQFDYEMDNGQARLTDRGTFQGSTLRSNFTGLLQGHTGQEISAESNFQAGQQGASVSNGVSVGSEFSGSNSQHCTLKRVGSVRVRQFTSVHENNANAAEAWW